MNHFSGTPLAHEVSITFPSLRYNIDGDNENRRESYPWFQRISLRERR
jgi:hypothetical protein